MDNIDFRATFLGDCGNNTSGCKLSIDVSNAVFIIKSVCREVDNGVLDSDDDLICCVFVGGVWSVEKLLT